MKLLEFPVCQRKGCQNIIKDLKWGRYYIDLINNWGGTYMEAKNKGYKIFPEGRDIGDSPLFGPYCGDCIKLLVEHILKDISKSEENI